MRMYAGGGEQRAGMQTGEFHGRDTAGHACAGDDHLQHPLAAGALDHRGAVAVKTIVGQVGADVDPMHGATVMRDGVA